MTWVAVAAVLTVAVTVAAAFQAFRWQARAHDRQQLAWTAERRELVETVAHLSDRPLPERGWERGIEYAQPIERPRLLADPEQLPKN